MTKGEKHEYCWDLVRKGVGVELEPREIETWAWGESERELQNRTIRRAQDDGVRYPYHGYFPLLQHFRPHELPVIVSETFKLVRRASA